MRRSGTSPGRPNDVTSRNGLTAEGERLVVWAKRILAEHDAFNAEVRAVRSGITGILRLGAVPTASTTASLVLSAFCSDHPLVKVHIHSRLATTELYRRLRDFEVEAAIVRPLPDEVHDVELVPLYEERITIVPQVETDSVASMLAQVATGHWACIVPHTWLWTTLMPGDIRVFEMVAPVLTAQITVATNSSGPGSPVARAFRRALRN